MVLSKLGRQLGCQMRKLGRFLRPSTVKSTLLRNQLRDQGQTLDRPGRPPILSEREKRLILLQRSITNVGGLRKLEPHFSPQLSTFSQLHDHSDSTGLYTIVSAYSSSIQI